LRNVSEKREAYIRVAIAMAKAGAEDLQTTSDKSQYFLRGIIDWAEDGGKANLNHKRAPLTYGYSVKASSLKFDKSAYEDRNRKESDEEKELKRLETKLHAEHVIPNNVVFKKFVEMVRQGENDAVLGNFLRKYLKVIIITKFEQKKLDGKEHFNLKDKMPDGWDWGDNRSRYARFKAAGIEIEKLIHKGYCPVCRVENTTFSYDPIEHREMERMWNGRMKIFHYECWEREEQNEKNFSMGEGSLAFKSSDYQDYDWNNKDS